MYLFRHYSNGCALWHCLDNDECAWPTFARRLGWDGTKPRSYQEHYPQHLQRVQPCSWGTFWCCSVSCLTFTFWKVEQKRRQRHEFLIFLSYGSNYYSYTYVQALRQATWQKLFNNQPLSRSAGNQFAKTILSPGCSRDYHDAVVDLLGSFPSSLAANVIHGLTWVY